MDAPRRPDNRLDPQAGTPPVRPEDDETRDLPDPDMHARGLDEREDDDA